MFDEDTGRPCPPYGCTNLFHDEPFDITVVTVGVTNSTIAGGTPTFTGLAGINKFKTVGSCLWYT